MQNGALQDYPLDEDDLENFDIRNLSRFVVVTLGSQGLPRSSQGFPRGSQGLACSLLLDCFSLVFSLTELEFSLLLACF